MEAFVKWVQDWGLVILFVWLYSVLRYGKANRDKYDRWDQMREKQRKEKWRKKRRK